MSHLERVRQVYWEVKKYNNAQENNLTNVIFFRRVAGFGVILSRSISPTELRISSTCQRAFLPFATHA